MRHLHEIEAMQNTCVAMGDFDGMHLGHRAVLKALTEESRKAGCRPVVICMPTGGKERLVLTTEQEKAYMMETMGVDTLISLASKQPGEADIAKAMDVKLFVAGGTSSRNDVFRAAGIPVRQVETVCMDGEAVSRDRVMKAVKQGNMEEVARLCQVPYHMLGKVVHGKALGRTVGMPTANLSIYGTKQKPLQGVYATRTSWGGKSYLGVTNVGTRPSVDDCSEVTIETMLADFSGDLYGEKVMTEFCCFLREVRKFHGIEEVWRQVQHDLEQARELLGRSL